MYCHNSIIAKYSFCIYYHYNHDLIIIPIIQIIHIIFKTMTIIYLLHHGKIYTTRIDTTETFRIIHFNITNIEF